MNHVILGNGPAGVIAAETLRKADPSARIALVGDEPEPPYSRMAIPYLLIGNIDEPGTYLRKGKDHFQQLRIDQFHARAASVDTAARKVTMENGSTLHYDRLLIATGCQAVSPPIAGMHLPGVHPCWTLADARKITQLAKPGARVLQMGAGFIGCIILEALATRGVRLTVVEMGDRMVPRMMTPVAGTLIKQWCEKKGVRVHTGTRVESITEAPGEPGVLHANAASPEKLHPGRPEAPGKSGVLHAKLSTGDTIVADLVISATGVKPNIGFLAGSGIATNVGVIVDETLQTNVPGVYAAGDVAEARDFSTGQMAINAIQPNAAEQARIAALNMAGKHAVSQGSLAMNVLATLGLISSSFGMWWGAPGGQSAEAVDAKNFRYLSLEFKDDVLVGATSLGLTEHVGVLRGLVQSRRPLGKWKDALLADPTRVMEAYLAAAQKAA